MDIDEVGLRARRLLMALTLIDDGADTNTLFNTASGGDERWLNDPDEVRLNMRALDLLTRLDYARVGFSGYTYEVTTTGRFRGEIGLSTDLDSETVGEWAATQQLVEALNLQRNVDANSISQLRIQDWRQFHDVDIVFHPRVTILTGENGAGKTTLLNILGQHFNWPIPVLSMQTQEQAAASAFEIGRLEYANGNWTALYYSAGVGITNAQLRIPQLHQVPGIFINSHRTPSPYAPLESLPPRFSEWHTLQQQFDAEMRARFYGGSSDHSPLYRMKEALVAAAVYGFGNQVLSADEAARELWEGFQEVLRRVLPSSLQFERFEVNDAELVLVTRVASFPLEAVSGGVSALLEMAWQIFLRKRNQIAFTVCIDEPENHLHPELQRSILPSLVAGFPDVSFVVATHSPFVVTSIPNSFVYTIEMEADGRFSSRRLESVNRTATPDETLQEVLGLDSALPLWAESRLHDLLETIPATPSLENLRELQRQLVELGLDRQFPAAISSLGVEE